MTIVHAEAKAFTDYIGTQKVKDVQALRPLGFTTTVKTPDGELLYNSLTRCMVLLKDGERDDADTRLWLARHWFYVTQDTDDCLFASQLRQLIQAIVGTEDRITSFHILTTTDCNARCFYCYEQGIKRVNMTAATAHDVAAFVRDKAKGHRVSLHWFGGEPLYNLPVIDIICKDLMAWGITYNSYIITNGYLFNDFVCRKAVDLWHLRRMQITLDGTREIYNRTKDYIYHDNNAFDRVVANICRAADAGIRINVRLNAGMHNIDDLNALTDYLKPIFSKHQGIHTYINQLFMGEQNDYHPRMLTPQEQQELSAKTKDLQAKINENESCGVPATGQISSRITCQFCMADNPHVVTISPEGKLGRCEEETGRNYYGDIWHGVTDRDAYISTTLTRPAEPMCRSCVWFPDCHRLKCCINSRPCDEARKAHTIEAVHQDMMTTYMRWKEKQNNKQEG